MKTQFKKRIIPSSVFNMLGACLVVMVFAVAQVGLSVYAYADSRLTLSENIKKLSLVQTAMSNPQSIEGWNADDLRILLNVPSLTRQENHVTAWTYHGESCAMDIYFDAKNSVPDYVEFRPLSLNAAVQLQYEAADAVTQKLYCLKDILEAQGVNTPSSYVRQPLPSWESPYSMYKPA